MARLAFLFLPCSFALYATVPYPFNAYTDPSANNTGKPYDATNCAADGYLCELPPKNADRPKEPTPVYLHLDVVDIPTIDEVSGSFTAQFRFSLAWRDDRIVCVP
jgi:hypothetical protein